MAAGGIPTAEKDRKTILGSLGKHVSGYADKPKSPDAQLKPNQNKGPGAKPKARVKTPVPPAPAPPKVDISHLDKMSGLEDQHPAVIEQRLARLPPQERKAHIARLSGEAARHVSLLSLQRQAASRQS